MKHPIIITSGGEVTNRDKYNKSSIISNLLSSSSGRQMLAQSMIAPIRRRFDYQSLARKVFLVDQMPVGAQPTYVNSGLPSGDLPVYDSDTIVGKFKYDSIKISSRGRLYRKGQLSGSSRRAIFPTFQLAANPTIKLSDVKARRFDIIDRSVQKLKESITFEEDSMIFDILDKSR